ncbi:MAG: hypothetical protein WAT41_00035 [Flavobacteriales bacterium]
MMNRPYPNMERAHSLRQGYAAKDYPRKASPSLMERIRVLWDRLVAPTSREGFSLVPVTDHTSGWRQTLDRSRRR